ncbi:MAG: 2-C-methyl-D-erythritol 2,4-cyclodiphosphate synthase [Bacteroides sp.]|nr:2-C-methyl-D-erythritol 2,4-cyclodiphosphate synthase [Bacteroides sp.]
MRIGHGYDVHLFKEGRRLILGGVEIPFEKGLDGHSDADVLVHAIMDALLGAAGLPDIGKLFPDTDVKYEGISSLKLLEAVRDKLYSLGYSVGNIDCTVVMLNPKIGQYTEKMKSNICGCLNIEESRLNIKATTEEGAGLGENAAGAHAVVLLNGCEGFFGGVFG